MNNSVFGKSIENKRKHMNVQLALNEKQCEFYTRKPNFDLFQILNPNVVILKSKQTHVCLDKPIAIGFTVLELSKHYMYTLHYKIFKDYYKNNINLIYTDTDSLIYEIQTNDFNNDLRNYFKPLMDFSNFDMNDEFFSENHKKKIGYLKFEYGNKVINEFIGLKSKLYSILYDETQNKKAAKGLQKATLKKYVNHEHYRNVILNNKIYINKMKRIESKKHSVNTVEVKKLIFHPFEDKRYILDDGINSVPFGHKDIKKLKKLIIYYLIIITQMMLRLRMKSLLENTI